VNSKKGWFKSSSEPLQHAWTAIQYILETLGFYAVFVARGLKSIFVPRPRWANVVDQFEFIGNGSLFIIALTGLFTGGVGALQAYYGLSTINGDSLVGPVTALGLTRELAPVLTGLMVTGRAGAAMAAQIGTMRVGQQIDALEVMGVDPFNYLIGPRILSTLLAMPLLCGVFILIGNIGSWFVGVDVLMIDQGIYLAKLQDFVKTGDLIQGLLKAFMFGLVLSCVGTYCGYYTTGGANGVGRATNRAVVTASVLILVVNFFVTPILREVFS
jgi:phospholipid/cholesterol/gamma-HCH transport system permease protein